MNKEQVIARLEHWKEMLNTACGDRKNKSKSYVNPLTYAETIQQIEEDEDIKDYFNVNVVFYKDLEYKWQYEIRLMYRNNDYTVFCDKIVRKQYHKIFDRCIPDYLERTTFGYAESNVFKKFFKTRLEAEAVCAKHVIERLDYTIFKIKDL
jgi:hypothetical protein